MTGWSVGRLVGWLVGWLVARSLAYLVAAVVVWMGWLVPLLERGHLSSQQVPSYASNFLYNETPVDEMTNVIKASSHRRSGIPEIFTTRNARPYRPPPLFLFLSRSLVITHSFTTVMSSFDAAEMLLRISGCL